MLFCELVKIPSCVVIVNPIRLSDFDQDVMIFIGVYFCKLSMNSLYLKQQLLFRREGITEAELDMR